MFNNKSTTNFSWLIWGLAIISCASCVSCDSKSTSSGNSLSTEFVRMSAATCSNQSPSGELVATRIPSATINTKKAGLYEGPVWINDALYFSHFTFTDGFPSRILKLDESGNLTTVLKNAGSNGLAADVNGNLLLASHKDKGLSRYNLQTKKRELLVGQYNQKVFNSPNDIAVTREGIIYFTDPNYQKAAASGGQDGTRVYRVSLEGDISVVDASLYNPNGISLSPDEKYLYVVGNENLGVLRKYEIVDGIPQAGVTIAKGINVPDGLAVDCAGNIYVTEHLGKQARVYTPEGQQIATIKVDANITNAAFGGVNGKTLYLTGAGAVWKVDLNITGSAY